MPIVFRLVHLWRLACKLSGIIHFCWSELKLPIEKSCCFFVVVVKATRVMPNCGLTSPHALWRGVVWELGCSHQACGQPNLSSSNVCGILLVDYSRSTPANGIHSNVNELLSHECVSFLPRVHWCPVDSCKQLHIAKLWF